MWTKENQIILATKVVIAADCIVNLLGLRMRIVRSWTHMPVYQHSTLIALMILYVGFVILLSVKKLDSRQLFVLVQLALLFTMMQSALSFH